MEIRNKREFYDLYTKGLLGNRALAWNSLDELLKSNWRGGVCIRGTGIPRTSARFDIPFEGVDEEIKKLREEGIPLSILRFNQSMPNMSLVLQGEVMRFPGRLELTYTRVKKPMNQALKEEERYISGLNALMLLKRSLDPSSLSDVELLMDTYGTGRGSAVVEFSTYSVPVGDIPNRNTVIWEVRNY